MQVSGLQHKNMSTTILTDSTSRVLDYIGAQLYLERTRLGLSQLKMAQKCGLAKSNYQALETRTSPAISLGRIIDIADRLQLSLGNLLPPEMLVPLAPPALPGPAKPAWVDEALAPRGLQDRGGQLVHPRTRTEAEAEAAAAHLSEHSRPKMTGGSEFVRRLSEKRSPEYDPDAQGSGGGVNLDGE